MLNKTYKSISVIFLITIGIKLIDIIKNLIMASKMGVSNNADVFSALIAVPDSLLVLVGIDSIRGVVNSEYSTLYSDKKFDSIQNSFNNLFKIILIFSFPIFLLLFIFNNEIISIMFPGFSGMKKDLAVQISYFIFPVFIFKAIGGFVQSIYNSTKRFYYPVILSSLISISMIISIFIPYKNDNIIFNLSIAYLTGNILIVIFMLANFKNLDLSINFKLPQFDELTKKIIKSCGSITILVLFNQLFLSSRMFFASYYGEGSISSLNYSSAITTFITALAFNSIFSVLLSNMSSLDLIKDSAEIKKLYLGTIEIILYIFIPFAGIFILFDTDIIKLFYFRGNFDSEAIVKVSYPFFWDSLSIISWILYIIPTAFFLAMKKYKILTIYGSISYLIGVFLNYYLSDRFGYYGVAIASFITTLLYGCFLLYKSGKVLNGLGEFYNKLLKIYFCGIVPFVIIYLLKIYYLSNILENNSLLLLIAGSFCFIIIYFVCTLFFKVNYLKNIKNYIKF